MADEQDALRDDVKKLTYLMTRLLGEFDRNKKPEEFDKPVDWHLYFKCSRNEAFRVLGISNNGEFVY